jgi:hypothetical protein
VYVFSRKSFAWEGLASERIGVIPPTIDVFSPKNRELDPDTVLGVLHAAGVIAVKRDADAGPTAYARHDETPSRVDRRAELFGTGAVPADVPVVLQVSRRDTLKDPPDEERDAGKLQKGQEDAGDDDLDRLKRIARSNVEKHAAGLPRSLRRTIKLRFTRLAEPCECPSTKQQ